MNPPTGPLLNGGRDPRRMKRNWCKILSVERLTLRMIFCPPIIALAETRVAFIDRGNITLRTEEFDAFQDAFHDALNSGGVTWRKGC